MIVPARYTSREAIERSWEKALATAHKQVVKVERQRGDTWLVVMSETHEPHTVTVTNPYRPRETQCDCVAAQHGYICKHRAAVAFCRQHRIPKVERKP